MSAEAHNVPEVLTLSEAALLLRVSAPTLRRLVARGDVPGMRIGRQWRLERDDLTGPQRLTGPRAHTSRSNRKAVA
jgi:excisionase family DNA binding protein